MFEAIHVWNAMLTYKKKLPRLMLHLNNAMQVPIIAVLATTFSTVKVRGRTPRASRLNQIASATTSKAINTPAQLVRSAADRSPCISNENVVVMPQDGQPMPNTFLNVHGGSPS